MAVAHPTHGGRSGQTGGGPVWHFAEWFVGIVGGIGVFLGLFTLFAGDDDSIGLGGDWSWEVGEISTVVKYVLLIGGAVLVLIGITMAIAGRSRPAKAHVEGELSNVLWHAGVFAVVNTLVWLQDAALGGGIEYAYWVTIPWGIGLIAHIVAYTRARQTGT